MDDDDNKLKPVKDPVQESVSAQPPQTSENIEVEISLEEVNGKCKKTKKEDSSGQVIALQREIGLFSAIGLIVSVMIGSGIFVSPAIVLMKTGSVGFCLVVWAVCGLISYLGALAFAELGTVVKDSGAEYAYFQAAFVDPSRRKFLGSLPSFIYAWTIILVVRPAEVAILVLTFSEYTFQLFSELLAFDLDLWMQSFVKKAIAVLAIALITFVNYSSVKLYVKIQNIFSSLKVLACFLVIGTGLFCLIKGYTEHISTGFDGTKLEAKNIVLAFYGGLWAFDGWTSVTVVTEEIKNPDKNIPRSISIGVPLITFLYLLMNLSYMTVLSKEEIITSNAVATVLADKWFGPMAFIIPVGVALSTFGCGMSVQFGVSRLCFSAGRSGHMLQALSFIHVTKLTPGPAVVFQGLLSFAYILSGSVDELIEFVSFLIWIFYGMAMVALLLLRKKRADAIRPYKVPIFVPIMIIMISVVLAVIPIVLRPEPQFLAAIGFICLGVGVYYVFVYRAVHPLFLDHFTFYVQILFKVVPPEDTSKKSVLMDEKLADSSFTVNHPTT